MSMPQVPDLTPLLTLTRDDAINLILVSSGLQELSLAHLLNAEAEKTDFALGLLKTSPGPVSIEEMCEMSKQTRRMLRDTSRSQMLIGINISEMLELITR